MKKLIFLFVLIAGSFTVNAQTSLKSQYGNTVDTVTNAATKYLTLSQSLAGYYKTLAVSVTVTEISGTTGGTVSLEASLDGTNWYSVYTSMDTSYTFTPADVSTAQSFRFTIPAWADKNVRVKYVGTGTMSAKVSASLIARN